MEKKTAIDWLIEKLANLNPTQIEWHEAIEEAKILEKENITKAILDSSYGTSLMTKDFSEKHYQETIILKCTCGSLTTIERPLNAPPKAKGMNTIGCDTCQAESHTRFSRVYNFKYDYKHSYMIEDMYKKRMKLIYNN